MALLLPFLAGSCKDGDDAGPGTNRVLLSFNTALVNSALSRADADWTQNPERMHTLRIIIVNGKKELEYNYLLELDKLDMTKYTTNPGMSYGDFGELQFSVTRNDTKTIYLLANAENLSYNVETINWKDETVVRGLISGGINSLVLKGYGSTGDLPMTAVHQITVGSQNMDLTNEPLYIVPVANKLELTFQNKRTEWNEEIKVTKWTLDAVADCSYLLPKVDETTFETNKGTSDWMQWMKEKCEETEDADAWLTEYSIPMEAKHATYAGKVNPTLTAGAEATSISPVYIPESKYNPDANDIQQYTLTVTTQEGTETKTYSALLPNLGSLFRDTHVKIDVTFNEAGLSLEVDLYPYTGVDLEPDFGIDVPTTGGGTETPGE